MWLGPPDNQNRITDFLAVDDPFVDPAAADVELPAQALDAKVAPAIPAIPACKNQRRDPTVNAGRAAANSAKSLGEIDIINRLHMPENTWSNA